MTPDPAQQSDQVRILNEIMSRGQPFQLYDGHEHSFPDLMYERCESRITASVSRAPIIGQAH
jgi:hypothetical protein